MLEDSSLPSEDDKPACNYLQNDDLILPTGTGSDAFVSTKEEDLKEIIPAKIESDAFESDSKVDILDTKFAIGDSKKEEDADIKFIKSEPQDTMIVVEDHKGPLARPQKRQRLKMEVVVPTLDGIKRERLIKKEEDCKLFESFRNPNVQKKEDMEFKMEILIDRLEANGIKKYDVTLPKEICDFRVPRSFISNVYGGNPQDTFSCPAQKFVDKHGMPIFLCLNLQEHQPGAPQNPGDPGLFYNTEPGCIHDYGPMIVFTRVETKPACLWQMMGLYVSYPSRPLSKEEWASQTYKVRRTWAKSVVTKSWGGMARARIMARREPKHQGKVTEEEALEAYLKGEEILQVWTLRCIGYDENFQNDIRNKFPTWVPTWKDKKPKGGKKSKIPQDEKPSTMPTSRKRKRAESFTRSVESSGEDDEVIWVDSDNEEDIKVDSGVYQPKGTRSRPLCL